MNWLERFAEEMKNEQRSVYLYGAGFIEHNSYKTTFC